MRVRACLLIALATAAPARAEEAPSRDSMVAQVRQWTSLPLDRAIFVLDNLRPSEARAALRAGPGDVVPFLAIYARELGDELPDVVAPLFDPGTPAAASRAAELVAAAGNTAAAADALPLLPDSRGTLQKALVEMLGTVNPPGSEAALREMLDLAESPGERALALSGLAKVATSASQTAVLPHLQDEDALVRTNAARALGRLQDDDVASALRARLKGEKDERVRRELTLALGAQGQPADLADLKRCLAQPIRRIDRAICLEAIALSPDPEAARALIGILTNKDSDLRREAAMGLGSRSEDVARTALISASEKEEDPTVVRFIVTSLGKLKESRGRERLKAGLEDPNVAFHCALALVEVGDASGVAILRVALRDREYRERALLALAKLKDKDAVPEIEKHCAKESRPAVRALVIQVLSSLPGA